MDEETRTLLCKLFAELRNANQMQNEAIDEFLSELGKPITEKTPGQATLTHPPKKSSELFSLNLIKEIEWNPSAARSGRPSITARPEDNVNNPKYEDLFQRVKTIKSKNENTWPFWISEGKLCRDRPKNWKT